MGVLGPVPKSPVEALGAEALGNAGQQAQCGGRLGGGAARAGTKFDGWPFFFDLAAKCPMEAGAVKRGSTSLRANHLHFDRPSSPLAGKRC